MEEYKQEILAVPFTYKQPSEATSLINKNIENVDVWIFSGPGLYPFAEKSKSKQPFFYLSTDGFSLLKALMEIGYKDGKDLRRISIDFLTEKNVKEIYEDLDLTTKDLEIKEYSSVTPLKDYLAFHEDLYHAEKIDICITSLGFIYEELKEQNIPIYRILPSRTNIRENLQAAIQSWDAHYSKKSQIATLFIKVKKNTQSHQQEINYDTDRLDLKLEELILDFSEEIAGSFVPVGMDTYIVFSTRGSLNERQHHIEDLLTKCALLFDLPMNIGIGYDETAYQAEENARSALYHSQKYGKYCAYLNDTNDADQGPLNNPEELNFDKRKVPDKILKKLKDCNVPLPIYHKVSILQDYLDNKSLTALDISNWLQMTERNARRILSELVEADLASITGLIPIEKGRPRNIYRLK